MGKPLAFKCCFKLLCYKNIVLHALSLLALSERYILAAVEDQLMRAFDALAKGRTFKFLTALGDKRHNKRPICLIIHLSIRDFTLTSCQRGSYLYINSPIIEYMKINDGIGKQHRNPLTQCNQCAVY